MPWMEILSLTVAVALIITMICSRQARLSSVSAGRTAILGTPTAEMLSRRRIQACRG